MLDTVTKQQDYLGSHREYQPRYLPHSCSSAAPPGSRPSIATDPAIVPLPVAVSVPVPAAVGMEVVIIARGFLGVIFGPGCSSEGALEGAQME
jgi:hypothetical protein